MPSISIENGKRIEELLEISKASSDSFFLVSETDLTRKITLQNLRNLFCGDSSVDNLNNLFYSVEKTNELMSNIYNNIDEINAKLDNFDNKINNIYDEIGGDLSEFKKYTEQIYSELKLADQNLQNSINTVNSNLTELINQVKVEIDNNIDTLGDRITIVENKLQNINGIRYGSNVPATLEDGVIYLQYF